MSEPSSSLAHAEYLAVSRFGSLDGLRAFAILAVLWHHTEPHTIPYRVFERTSVGVDLFFVLSGFLIVHRLLDERERGGIALGAFYRRRAARILPAYAATLAAVGVALAFVPASGEHALFFGELVHHATFTSDFVPLASVMLVTWSLSAEEQFYVTWPFVERSLGRAVPYLLAASIAANLAVSFGLVTPWLARWTSHDPFLLPIVRTTFTPILLGVALAHGLRDPRGYRIAARVLGGAWSPVIAAVAFVGVLHFAPVVTGPWLLALHLSATALVGACVLRRHHAASAILDAPILVRIGVISYGMYLFHMPLRHVAIVAERAVGAAPGLKMLVTTALTIAVAEASFRGFERPILRRAR